MSRAVLYVKEHNMKWWIVPGLVLVGLGLSPQARADDAAKAVIEKAIQASGGKEHIDKIKGGVLQEQGQAAYPGRS
jgi:hypothetical protein